MADKDKAKIDLGLLEEDDEFEEFPAEGNLNEFQIRWFCILILYIMSIKFTFIIADWTGTKEDEDEVNVWEDNWDDDNVEDDFNQQLRAQLENQKSDQK